MTSDLRIQGEVVVNSEQAEGAFNRVGDKATQMANEVATSAGKAGQAVDKIGDGAGASAEKFTRAESRISASIKRATNELELLGKTASQRLEFNIADKGLDAAKFEPALKKLRELEAQALQAQRAATGSLDKMGISAAQTAAALRGVPAQFTDIITSLQGGQAPLTVFLQQGGQLKDMFGGAGAAARGLGGYVVGLVNPFTMAAAAIATIAVAYKQGSAEADGYRMALVMTGNAAGTTAAQMQQMAQRISAVVGTQAAAAETLAGLAGSSRIAAENFEYFGTVALKVEKTVGTSVAETVKQFAELGKAPVEASKKLNEETNYLTQSIYEQIKALKDQGREADAASVAQKAWADSLNNRSAEMTQNLGLIEKAWKGVAGAAKSGWDAMLNVGRSSSMADEIANVRQQIAQAQGQDKNRQFSLPWDTPLADLQQRLSYLTEEERLMKRGAAAQAERAQAEKAAIEATDALGKVDEKALSKQEQMNNALGEYRANLEKVKAVNPNSALLDPAQVAKSEKAIREQFAERTKAVASGNSELQKQADLIAKLSGLDPSFSREWDMLSKAYKSGALNLDQLVDAQAALLSKQPAMTAQIKAQAEAEKERAKSAADLAKTLEAYAKAQQEGVAQGFQAAQQAEDQLAQYGMLKSEVQALTLAYLEQSRESAALAGEDVSNIDKRIAAQKRLISATSGIEQRDAAKKAAQDAEAEWKRTADSINNSLTDALLRGFESGKDFAKNLRDTVVNMFKTMILRPVISAVLSPVSMALSGLTGAGSAAAGQAGGSALGSAGGSLMGSALGGIGAFGTGASYGATSLFANGLTGTLAAGGQMIGAGSVMSGLGTIAGALGPIAIGIGLLSSLIKKSTPHMGGGSSYSAAGGLVSGAAQYQSGVYGFADSRKYDETAGKLTADLAKSVVSILDSTATSFGKQAGYSAATAFADDKSKDGAWGALLIEQMGKSVLNWQDTQNNKWAPKEFADGEAGQKEYLAAIAKSTRDALDAMDLPGWADDMLAALGDAPSLEGLAQTVDQINAASVALGKMRQNLDGFGGLTESAVSALVKAAGGMDSLIASASSYYDNFYSDSEKIANTTRDVSDALSAVGLQMPTTRDEFRKLVEAQMALGESGATAVAALLGVSGAFASITEAAGRAMDAATLERADRLAAKRAQEKAQAEALQKQIQEYADGAEQFDALRDSLLKAGDAAGLLAAATERAFADPRGAAPKWGANSTAASFNYEYGLQQAAMRQSLSNELSASALRVANVGGALGGLSVSSMMGQDDPVIRAVYIGMRDAMVQAAGDAGFAVRDAVDGAALYAAQAQVRAQFSATGPGLASVYAARESYGLASSNTDVKVYEDAQRKLNGALSSGAIGADQFARALQALNDTLPQAAALSGDFDAQAARAAAALDELAQTGLRSIGYYFGQLNTMALELAKMDEPINATIASIGRLNSFETAFGVSADAAGATGLSSLQIDRAQLIAEAAGIASAAMTTADAAAAAAKLAQSPAFAELGAKGIRDAALLLDGVGQYNAEGFERAFVRISDALAKGSVTEDQYKALFDTALDMFEGVPEETRTLIDSMTRLRDAMSGFADGLLIDEQRTTLSAGATLAEMQRQYAQAFAGASTGDSEAIGKYQQLATTLLDKDLYSTRAEYNAAFGSVYGDARQLETIGINTLAHAQGNEMVSELKDMNAKLNKRVEDLEKNLLAALAQIAKNTSDTSRGIEQQIVMAEETP